jgi:hypothetical protein
LQAATRTTPGRPYLYINIPTSKRDGTGLYAYYIAVELNQDVWLPRDLDIETLKATTWRSGAVGSIGGTKIRDVRESVLDLVDEFINAYLAVNPEQAGAGKHSRREENIIPDASIIRAVQWQLQEAGFDPGPVDGKLGTQTRLALRQYQGRQRLPITGELDETTRRGLGLK